MRDLAGRIDNVERAVWAHSKLPLPRIRAQLDEMTRPKETEDGDAQLLSDEPGKAAAVPA